MIHSSHSSILNTVCKHAVFYVVFTWQFSKSQKISKTPQNTSIIQRTEYCSQVSRLVFRSNLRLQTGSTVKCIMFSLIPSKQILAITLNLAMTTLVHNLMIHVALIILSPCTVSSEQMTVLLNKSYTNIWLHFQIQNNLISSLCFFYINTSNFYSQNHHLPFLEISISIFISPEAM